MKAKSTTHTQAETKKAAGTLLRENDALSDREIVAARLARAIGRGRDAFACIQLPGLTAQHRLYLWPSQHSVIRSATIPATSFPRRRTP